LVAQNCFMQYNKHINKKGTKMQTNCPLYYKIVKNKKLQTYRVVFTFDAHNRITVRNAALVTGDVANFTDSYDSVANNITKAVEQAKVLLRTHIAIEAE